LLTAHSDADGYISLHCVTRPTDTIAAPKCLLSDTIDFFARYFCFLFLARLAGALFAFLSFRLVSIGLFCERARDLIPVLSNIGVGATRIGLNYRKTNRLIRFHRGIIAL